MGRSAILRGATVVDGTGTEAARFDVLLEGDRISEVGKLGRVDADPVDLTGLVLAPGFIDPHTHYDAQVTWDQDLTPSCWHGITSVIMGHCGYSVAPTRPDGRESVVLTLENVEGMSAEALREGIEWSFETFPEYLDSLARRDNRLNVGALIGHTALRFYVMGMAATERAATPEEVTAMTRITREALDAGGLGFSTSRSSIDTGAYGKPVPSRLAEISELVAIARGMEESGRGVIQILPKTDDGQDAMFDVLGSLIEVSNRPITFAAVLSGLFGPRGVGMEVIERAERIGGSRLVPQTACRPITQQVTLKDPFLMVGFSEAFLEAYKERPERRPAVYSKPEWRARARASLTRATRIEAAVVAESATHPELIGGPSMLDLARARGVEPLDVMIDLALEDLNTRFTITLVNDDEDEVQDYLNDKRVLLSLSDAGAHASQICDAVYSTYLLGHWVREKQALPLELAVWHLTKRPAELFGLSGRGQIYPGFAADLVAFNPDTVGTGPLHRVYDLPTGADRLIGQSRGIEDVWVNGSAIRRNGKDLETVRPGRVLRSGSY
jgi:N-acyl-D-amino-acid deacylase